MKMIRLKMNKIGNFTGEDLSNVITNDKHCLKWHLHESARWH